MIPAAFDPCDHFHSFDRLLEWIEPARSVDHSPILGSAIPGWGSVVRNGAALGLSYSHGPFFHYQSSDRFMASGPIETLVNVPGRGMGFPRSA